MAETLTKVIADMPVENLRSHFERMLKDEMETDREIRKMVEPYLDTYLIYGDTYCIPTIGNIIEALIAQIDNNKKTNPLF